MKLIYNELKEIGGKTTASIVISVYCLIIHLGLIGFPIFCWLMMNDADVNSDFYKILGWILFPNLILALTILYLYVYLRTFCLGLNKKDE